MCKMIPKPIHGTHCQSVEAAFQTNGNPGLLCECIHCLAMFENRCSNENNDAILERVDESDATGSTSGAPSRPRGVDWE